MGLMSFLGMVNEAKAAIHPWFRQPVVGLWSMIGNEEYVAN